MRMGAALAGGSAASEAPEAPAAPRPAARERYMVGGALARSLRPRSGLSPRSWRRGAEESGHRSVSANMMGRFKIQVPANYFTFVLFLTSGKRCVKYALFDALRSIIYYL